LKSQKKNGGREEIRTPDPLLAKQVLSQLSYTPTVFWMASYDAHRNASIGSLILAELFSPERELKSPSILPLDFKMGNGQKSTMPTAQSRKLDS
jgi:hypothetical protein